MADNPENSAARVEDVAELVASLQQVGQLQPGLVVVAAGLLADHPQHAEAIGDRRWVLPAGHRHYDHDRWAAEDVLRVTVTEWPEPPTFQELPQGVTPATAVDPESWKTIFSINGRHCMAGDMTLEHGSLTTIEVANDILIALKRADADIVNAPSLMNQRSGHSGTGSRACSASALWPLCHGSSTGTSGPPSHEPSYLRAVDIYVT